MGVTYDSWRRNYVALDAISSSIGGRHMDGIVENCVYSGSCVRRVPAVVRASNKAII